MPTTSPAIRLLSQVQQPTLRLLCFPYAGGSANVFRGWEQLLGEVALSAIQLPGREWRRSDPLITIFTALIDSLSAEVAAWLDHPGPNYFFGYSMGAILAYELAARLARKGASARLDGLFVAASRAPQLGQGKVSFHQLSDDDFVLALSNLGGIPAEVLAEPDLIQLALPVLRADFEVLASYRWQDRGRLDCPVVVYGGSEDPLARRPELAGWRDCTANRLIFRLFSGGHFFINSARTQLLQTLAADLALA